MTTPETAVLATVLQQGWGLSGLTTAETLKPGRVWRVSCGTGATHILKNWGRRDPGLEERVAFYQEVMRHVSADGVPVEIAVSTVHDQHLYRHDGEAWWLTGVLENDPIPLHAPADLDAMQRAYGRAIAGMHRALASYPVERARQRTWSKDIGQEVVTSALPTIRKLLPAELRADFEALIMPHESEMARRLTGLPVQLIFYDCHHGNILRVGTRVTGFVDADHLSIGPRIWDLFYFIAQGISDIRRDHAATWPRHARVTLDAYAEVNPLEPRERQAIWSGMLAFKLDMLARVLSGSPLDDRDNLLDHLQRLTWVQPYFT
jgi:Ser/Thr protein kinase RdoA (MazF antagonist)